MNPLPKLPIHQDTKCGSLKLLEVKQLSFHSHQDTLKQKCLNYLWAKPSPFKCNSHLGTLELECVNFPGAEWTLLYSRRGTLHYGTKPGHFETSINHFPTSKGVSKVSERASERVSRGREQSKQSWASEWVSGGSKQANERKDERVAQYLHLYSCLFKTTMLWWEVSPPTCNGISFTKRADSDKAKESW